MYWCLAQQQLQQFSRGDSSCHGLESQAVTGSGSGWIKCSPSSLVSQSLGLASDLTDHAVLYDAALAAACRLAWRFAFLSSMILLNASTLCLVTLSCSSCNCLSDASGSQSEMKDLSVQMFVFSSKSVLSYRKARFCCRKPVQTLQNLGGDHVLRILNYLNCYMPYIEHRANHSIYGRLWLYPS